MRFLTAFSKDISHRFFLHFIKSRILRGKNVIKSPTLYDFEILTLYNSVSARLRLSDSFNNSFLVCFRNSVSADSLFSVCLRSSDSACNSFSVSFICSERMANFSSSSALAFFSNSSFSLSALTSSSSKAQFFSNASFCDSRSSFSFLASITLSSAAARGILESFAEQGAANCALLERALDEGDTAALKAVAHKMTPIFTMLGAVQVAAALRTAESWEGPLTDTLCREVRTAAENIRAIIAEAQKKVSLS